MNVSPKAGWISVFGSPELWARVPATLYAEELLAQAGVLNWRWAADAGELTADDVAVALVPNGKLLGDADAAPIRRFVEAGGRLLVLGRPGPLADLFEVRPQPPTRDGWLLAGPSDTGRYAAAMPVPLHVFDIVHVLPAGDSLTAPVNFSIGNHAVNWPVSSRVRTDRGEALLIAADLVGSIVRIQQGLAVHHDGEPAPDGSAPINDGILKCDDSIMLDWTRDRRTVVKGLPPIFDQPQCDLLRELLITALLDLAASGGLAVPMLDSWPRNLPAVGLLSHDSDHHDPAGLERQLDFDAQADIRASWCTMAGTEDGTVNEYTLEQLARIVASGHEMSFHYDAFTKHADYGWGRDNFRRQLTRLRQRMRQAGIDAGLYSNKNHYTRWEGRLDFFRWLEAEGIRVDQSRGPSKTGNLGWPFGTSHPWRVIDDEQSPPVLMDLLQVSFNTQDMGLQICPAEFGRHYVDTALARGGVVHLLFHPAHTHHDAVRDALLQHVAYARSKGFEWWTCRDIGRWQFARRALRLARFTLEDGQAVLALEAGEPLDGAVVRLRGAVDGGTDPVDLSGTCEVRIRGF